MIIEEIRFLELMNFLYRSEEKRVFQLNKKKNKRPIIGESSLARETCSNISGNLRQEKNPYKQEIEPHVYWLIEASLELYKISRKFDFEDNYWKPF